MPPISAHPSNHPIRPASEADIDRLVQVINRAYLAEAFCVTGDRTDAADIRARCKIGCFLVIDDPANPARLIAAVFVSNADGRGYLGMLTVDPDAQGRGLSRKLVTAAENFCRDAGSVHLDLTVISVRENLFPFYARLGFERLAVMDFPEPQRMRMPLHLVKLTKSLASLPANTRKPMRA